MSNSDEEEKSLEARAPDAEKPQSRELTLPDLFLKASDPSTWEKPEDTTWGDHFLKPNRALNQRQRELARMVAHGKTNGEISERLGYSKGRVSVLMSNTKIKAEIEKYRDRLFKIDEASRFIELGSDALDVMEEILIDPSRKAHEKESAAKWILEKTSGKAAQQMHVTHEGSLSVLVDKLDQMKQQGNVLPPPEPIDVVGRVTTATEDSNTEATDDFDDWLKENM